MAKKIRTHRDLTVYQRGMEALCEIFELSKAFPAEEKYSLTSQIRRSSRSVCANLAEAWRKRPYEAAFISKICDIEGEASETQVWIEIAVKCGYMERSPAAALFKKYDSILRTLVGMRNHPDKWVLTREK